MSQVTKDYKKYDSCQRMYMLLLTEYENLHDNKNCSDYFRMLNDTYIVCHEDKEIIGPMIEEDISSKLVKRIDEKKTTLVDVNTINFLRSFYYNWHKNNIISLLSYPNYMYYYGIHIPKSFIKHIFSKNVYTKVM